MQACPPLLWLRCLTSIIDFSPLTVEPETRVSEAIALMAKWGKHVLVESDSQVMGWLTERDVVRLLAARVDLETTKISEVMHTSDISLKLSEFADIPAILSLLQRRQLSLLPIVDEQGQLVGTITSDSLCQALKLHTALTNQIAGHDDEVRCIEGLTLPGKHQPFQRQGDAVFGTGEFSRIYCLTGSVEDIPEHQQTLEALRESEERFNIMADTAPVLLWMSGTDAACTFFNQYWLDFTGRTLAQELGSGWIQGVHPQDIQRCLAIYLSAFNARKSFVMEYRLRRADGEYRWLLDQGVPRLTPNGHFVGYIGSCVDITDLKEVNAELEWRVAKRTQALRKINQQLVDEISDRKLIEQALAERVRIADFRADFDTILIQSQSLKDMMRRCTEAIVQHLGIAFARIWILNKQENILELQVSSGIYTHIDGFHSRVPVGQYKIGLIAQDGKPHQHNAVLNDPRVSNKEWVLQEGMTAFAGYPLIVEGETLGVMAMFSRQTLTESTFHALGIAADEIAISIKHKLNQEALKHTEERFRNLVEASSDWVWEVNENAVYTYASPKVQEILGYTPQEILGKTPFELMPSAEAQRIANIFIPIVAAREPFKCLEKIKIHQDGHLVVLESSAVPIFDAEGQFRGYRGMDRDISDRKLAAECLLRLHKAIESTSDAVAISNAQGECIYLNPAFVKIYGYTLEELTAAGGAAVIFQQPEECQQLWATVMSGKSWRSESTMRTRSTGCPQTSPGASTIQVDLRSDAIKDVTGKIIGKVCIHTDITQRKQAESDLWLRDRAIAASNNGIIISDVTLPNAPIIYVNPAFESITGYSKAEVIGQNFRLLQCADINQSGLKQLDIAMERGQNSSVILRNYRKDGSLFWNQLNISPVYDPDGKLTHYISIQTDITERKQLEQELILALEKEKELSELKSRFITMISHEFRTPLSTILSSSELLEYYRHKWTEEKQLTHFHRMQTAVKRMTEMLNDILFIGKAEAGILDYQPTSLNLVAYCRHLVENLGLDINHQHPISFTSQFTSIPCNMDEKLLGTILNNLLSNAIKYSPAHSTIQLILSTQQELAVLQIQDQGIGIPPEDIPHLFKSFHRAQNVGNILGTGLGLAIVKNCVDIHQGDISVTSQLGVGTTFTLTLPLNRNGE